LCPECHYRLLFFSSLCVHSRALVSASSSRLHSRPRPQFSLAINSKLAGREMEVHLSLFLRLFLFVNDPEDAPYSQHACMFARSRPHSVSRFITRKTRPSRRHKEELRILTGVVRTHGYIFPRPTCLGPWGCGAAVAGHSEIQSGGLGTIDVNSVAEDERSSRKDEY
jgi:hypothetical protein